MPSQLSRALVVATLLMCVASASAQSKFEVEFDDKDKPWQEIAIQLPAPPKPENLARFHVSSTATQSFAVDTRSLTLGADGVIRYTMVTVSESGAKNVSYEGIRCATFERKLYAFGQPDGSWSRSRRDQWERISNQASNRQHAALAKDFFCMETTVAGKAEEMIERLRQNKPLGMQNYR